MLVIHIGQSRLRRTANARDPTRWTPNDRAQPDQTRQPFGVMPTSRRRTQLGTTVHGGGAAFTLSSPRVAAGPDCLQPREAGGSQRDDLFDPVEQDRRRPTRGSSARRSTLDRVSAVGGTARLAAHSIGMYFLFGK
jgi:hypothetical protein